MNENNIPKPQKIENLKTQKNQEAPKTSITLRMLFVGIVLAITLIASFIVRGVVKDRLQYAKTAQTSVVKTWGEEQRISTPVLLLEASTNDRIVVTPKELDVKIDLDTEKRSRGIFDVNVYTADASFEGSFDTSSVAQKYLNGKARVLVPLSKDAQIQKSEKGEAISFAGRASSVRQYQGSDFNSTYTFINNGNGETSSRTKEIYSFDFIGQEIELSKNATTHAFSSHFSVKGSRSISFDNSSNNAVVSVTSNWPHPSFKGKALPDTQEVSESGFDATWDVQNVGLSFDTNDFYTFFNTTSKDHSAATLQIELLPGIDIYKQTDRATKYAILFIALTFMTVFIYEIHRKIRVHPIQYFFIGIGLVLFYLLLLSLAEHTNFLIAYILGSLATISLITMYSMTIVGSKKGALKIGGLLSVLYIYLYILLNLQDFALLVGALVLFVVLAIVMYATRNINWYTLE